MRPTQDLVVGESTDDLIGRSVGGYVIQAQIGKGGMGAVYVGVHPTLDRKVAIKVLRAKHVADEELLRRFVDEARAASSIDHPAVVKVHDLARLPDGRTYILMEHFEGETVSARLKRAGKLPPEEAAAIVRDALGGLAAAHARGIVHRDVKPANLFLARRPDGTTQVKVLDFGIAKLHRDPDQSTQSGVVLGTPEYMAPEQASGVPGSVGPQTDVYAAGIVLYELLSGKPPFRSPDWAHVLVLHRTEMPAAIDGIPGELDVVLRRALSKDPALRYADAGVMQRALGGGGDTLATRDLRTPARAIALPRRRRWPWLVPPAVLAIAVAAFLLWPKEGGLRPQASGLSSQTPKTSSEFCRFEVTDQQGTVHRHGGARVGGFDHPGAYLGLSLMTDKWQVFCMATDTGIGNAWTVTLLVPRDAVKPGTYQLPDENDWTGYVTFSLQGMPPAGFDASNYASHAGTVTFTQAAVTTGARMVGELDATMLSNVKIRMWFDFKNE